MFENLMTELLISEVLPGANQQEGAFQGRVFNFCFPSAKCLNASTGCKGERAKTALINRRSKICSKPFHIIL